MTARQATVRSFDAATGAVTALTDEGELLQVPPAAFRASGLHLLRLGQRVHVDLAACRISLGPT